MMTVMSDALSRNKHGIVQPRLWCLDSRSRSSYRASSYTDSAVSSWLESRKISIPSRTSIYFYMSVFCVCHISKASSATSRGKREISHVHATNAACNGRTPLLSDLRCRVLRKRMIDVPLFTPTFRRPHLCYHMTDVMSYYAHKREPVTKHDRNLRLPRWVLLFLRNMTFCEFAINLETFSSSSVILYLTYILFNHNSEISSIQYSILYTFY